MKGLVNCNFLPGSARRLELGTVSAEPLSRAYWSQKLRPLGETVGLSRARTSSESPDSTQAGPVAQTFCREAPDGLSLAQFQPSPCRARTGRKNSGRSAKRLACRARVLLAKVPIALKRAVGLSDPSSERQSAPILQQWSEQVCRSFEAGQAMSHSDANCAKPRT